MKFYKIFSLLIILKVIICGCTANPLKVDVSEIELDIEFINVDSLYLNVEKNNLDQLHEELIHELDEIYLYEVSMNIRQQTDSFSAQAIYSFYQSEYIKALEKEKIKLESDVFNQKKLIIQAFKYLSYHFPNLKEPKQIIFINKLFGGIHCTDSVISVGLERYIDPQSEVIKGIPNDQLYEWQKEAMNIHFLARDIVLQWIQVHLFNEIDEHLANHIVQAGKILYVLQAAFPTKDGAFIMRYTDDDYKWATENEYPFWEYIVREEMLFKNNLRDKTNFLNEGPYTIGLPEKGPDRLGQFLGWKMVNQFMNSSKELSLQELIRTEYNTILQQYEID